MHRPNDRVNNVVVTSAIGIIHTVALHTHSSREEPEKEIGSAGLLVDTQISGVALSDPGRLSSNFGHGPGLFDLSSFNEW